MREHIAPILQSLHWLPIRMRVIFKICTYIFKIMHGLAPDYLNCVVVCYAPTRALRSACDTTLLKVTCDTTLLKVTLSKKTIGQSSVAVTGRRMWNNLPKYVRSAGTLMAFRKKKKGIATVTSHLSVSIYVSVSVYLSVCLSLCQSISQSVCLSACLYLCVSISLFL